MVADGDPAPRNGDDDEGFALRLDSPSGRSRSTWASSRRSRATRRSHPPVPDLTAGWFGAPALPPGPSATPARLYAADGGLVVLRSGPRRLMMDVGPLGYLSIAAHGHADALAVTSASTTAADRRPGRRELLRPPGWRTAHRSTLTHATVTVDDSTSR